MLLAHLLKGIDMRKYNKAVMAVLGGIIGIGVTFGILPESLAENKEAIAGAISTLLSTAFVIFGPRNADNNE